jgi:hypothetical protein
LISQMAEPVQKPVELGLYPRKEQMQGLHATDIVGGILSVLWVTAVLAYIFSAPPTTESQTLGLVMTLLVVFLPLVLIWVAVATLRTVRALRAEAGRLQAAVDAMRHAYVVAQQTQASGGLKSSVERKIDEIAVATRQTETALASFNSRRDTTLTVASADRKAALVAPLQPQGEEQPALALGTPAEDFRAPLSVADFIRAMNFPETPDDKDGFRALRRALEDRNVTKLIRAAQDVLTLLSQDGIYMDDLKPDLARPEVWRRFAAGERGRSIAALGGIRDRSSLALTAARMREDMVFRDAGHHFLRSFDKTFAVFEANATDSDLADLADTRTARAFMLFGRVTGTFD